MGPSRMRILKSLNNSFDILELFLTQETYTLREVTEACALTKAGAHTILANLVHREYLHYNSLKRQYSLGLKTWQLGSRLLDTMDMRRIALPVLEELSHVSGETALLSRFANGSVVYLECVVGPASVASYTRPGARAPAFCTASGKAQLAFALAKEIDHVLSQGLARYTQYTITDPADLRSDLGDIRRIGYSVNRGEYREDVVGVGAPIFDKDGHVIGAVGLSGPAYRLGRQPQDLLSKPLTKSVAHLQRALASSSVSALSYEVTDGDEVA